MAKLLDIQAHAHWYLQNMELATHKHHMCCVYRMTINVSRTLKFPAPPGKTTNVSRRLTVLDSQRAGMLTLPIWSLNIPAWNAEMLADMESDSVKSKYLNLMCGFIRKPMWLLKVKEPSHVSQRGCLYLNGSIAHRRLHGDELVWWLTKQ